MPSSSIASCVSRRGLLTHSVSLISPNVSSSPSILVVPSDRPRPHIPPPLTLLSAQAFSSPADIPGGHMRSTLHPFHHGPHPHAGWTTCPGPSLGPSIASSLFDVPPFLGACSVMIQPVLQLDTPLPSHAVTWPVSLAPLLLPPPTPPLPPSAHPCPLWAAAFIPSHPNIRPYLPSGIRFG